MCLGTSCSVQTFTNKTRPFVQEMDNAIKSLLQDHTVIVAAIDNNQKGHNVTFQRFGSSNKFVKVTARFLRKAIICDHSYTYDNVPVISFKNQAIPSPIAMPPFELVTTINSNLLQDPTCICDEDAPIVETHGSRVEKYIDCLNIINLLTQIQKYLTWFNKKENKFKHWVKMQSNFTTQQRNTIVKKLHSLKNNFLSDIQRFQQQITEITNPSTTKPSQCIIPPVSFRDEVTTEGFGLAVIELLVYSGVLDKIKHEKHSKWVLGKNWHKKQVYLCLDGLSLDRHRCFLKRLTDLPVSFQRAYQQGIIFRQALSQVVEIPGPLHQAFHLLQCVFNVYGHLIKIAANVIGWKKINYSDVSQTFHLV